MLVVSFSGVCRCTYVMKMKNQQPTTATRADNVFGLWRTRRFTTTTRDVCCSNASAADRDKFANDLIRMLIVQVSGNEERALAMSMSSLVHLETHSL